MSLFQGTDPLNRPSIPTLKNINKARNIIIAVNETLREHLTEPRTLEEVHLALYCGAVTVIELNGQRTYYPTPKEGASNKTFIPAWRKRLELDVDKLRGKADVLNEYLHGNRSKKITKKVTVLSNLARISLKSPQHEQQLIDLRDRFRQQAKAKGARLRRYNEISKRKKQNSEFLSDRKKFFRELEKGAEQQQHIGSSEINTNEFQNYWSSLWSEAKHYNKDADWINNIERRSEEIGNMTVGNLTAEDIKRTIRTVSNWKSPGPDKLHNFWVKKFTASHASLARGFSEILEDPSKFPGFLAEGNTFMLFKKGDPTKPNNYRPITCLSVLYKLFTSLINNRIYEHCITNGILQEEQKGCIRGSLGCKHQLTIDAVVLKQVQNMKRNLHMCYIDYSKAFDSVPHDWLIKVLQIYKIHPKIVTTLQHIMSTWKTNILINNNSAGKVQISRGIFQGDSLSPIWFCLALNPLSTLLNSTNLGYRINRRAGRRLTHLLYMDDLKLYSESENGLCSLVDTVKTFSNDISMSFGLDKCAIINIKKGAVQEPGEPYEMITVLPPEETYKYLGAAQNQHIDHTELKKQFVEKYKARVTKILNTKLSSKNLITALNSWAIPVLTYTFGILKWSDADLNDLDRLTRSLMTKFRCLHTNSSVKRLYLPRKIGGRGLINIYNLCRTQEQKMRQKLLISEDSLMQLTIQADKNYTPLNLQHQELIYDLTTRPQNRTLWTEQVLHGKFPRSLESENIDKRASLHWLESGYLYPETEGFLMAIQDRVMRTRNYEKHCLKLEVEDKCRKCGVVGESIEHIIAGCPALSDNAYLGRHNQVAKIIHQQLTLKHKLLESCPPYYKYQPKAVLESNEKVLYWDRPITTDRTVDYNRPDIVLIDKASKTGLIIDISVPLSHNVGKVESEKIVKYENLAIEMKNIWQLNKVTVLPFVISAEGIISKNFSKNLKQIGLQDSILGGAQKAVLLQTCHIVRKFLG